MHRLLKRQVKRYLGDLESIPENWTKFLQAVDDAYEQSEAERSMLERTIELTSQELLELNSQIRAAIPDTFLRLDSQGTILDYKPCQNAIAYLSASKVVGESLQSLLPDEVCQKFMVAIATLDQKLASEVSIVHELVLAGQECFYEARVLPLLERQVVVIVRDITEQKRAETALKKSQIKLREKTKRLATTLKDLKTTQAKLVHTEKMSGLGQLVAGIAHEINNPISFIGGNVAFVNNYVTDLLNLLHLYQKHYPDPAQEIQLEMQRIDLEFLISDLNDLQRSMNVGVERISAIVNSLRTFSRLDEADRKAVNIHDGIDSTLLILQHRLMARQDRQVEIAVIKNYGDLPKVECYAGQLNQVFMHVITNAIDAIDEAIENASSATGRVSMTESPHITIQTESLQNNWIAVRIANNGPPIPESALDKLFDPFFTTKPVGQGTGLGLSISYQIIVNRHGGKMWCRSSPRQETVFGIEIPIQQCEA